jgi:hypothetical protein
VPFKLDSLHRRKSAVSPLQSSIQRAALCKKGGLRTFVAVGADVRVAELNATLLDVEGNPAWLLHFHSKHARRVLGSTENSCAEMAKRLRISKERGTAAFRAPVDRLDLTTESAPPSQFLR